MDELWILSEEGRVETFTTLLVVHIDQKKSATSHPPNYPLINSINISTEEARRLTYSSTQNQLIQKPFISSEDMDLTTKKQMPSFQKDQLEQIKIENTYCSPAIVHHKC